MACVDILPLCDGKTELISIYHALQSDAAVKSEIVKWGRQCVSDIGHAFYI